MSVISQNNTVVKSNSKKYRVLQRRHPDNSILFSEYDIRLVSSFAGAPVSGAITVTFTGDNQNIISVWQIGENSNLYKLNNTLAITKNFTANQDNNGVLANNQAVITDIFFENVNSITGINISSSNVGLYSCTELKLPKQFPNLKQINLSTSRLSAFASLFSQAGLERLSFDIHTGESSAVIFKNSAPTTNLKWISIGGYNAYLTNITDYLNPTIKYVMVGNCPNLDTDLGKYFTGTRMGFSLPFNGLVRYNGGAIFPSIILEDIGQPIDYIVNQGSSVSRKLTALEAARFIVDFANQVVAVNLAQKRIRLAGTTPDTSYADNSQEKYKTYDTALNYITSSVASGGLGVNVLFI